MEALRAHGDRVRVFVESFVLSVFHDLFVLDLRFFTVTGAWPCHFVVVLYCCLVFLVSCIFHFFSCLLSFDGLKNWLGKEES